ncbi:MAG TPA: hypothetical protein VLC46_01130 [Thermoanaerobaculia bacterium]|nr:hypothetical protein [Thermoanaerobaculia bacterium]
MPVVDPNTEPIPDLPPLPISNPAPAPSPEPPPTPTAAFDRSRFQFMSGIPAGETAYIRAEDGNAVLSYRSFASIVGVIAALMTAIVLAAGAAGALLLLMDHRLLPAIAALILSTAFAGMIVMLIPATSVTIFDAGTPAIAITQQPGFSFPSVTYVVTLPDGKPIARIAKSFFSRFGRNRWRLRSTDDFLARGEAVEESFGRALLRKALGKFAPAYQSNLRITWNGEEAGWIIRRPDPAGHADVLDLNPASTLDRRVAVAVAVLVLGSEP